MWKSACSRSLALDCPSQFRGIVTRSVRVQRRRAPHRGGSGPTLKSELQTVTSTPWFLDLLHDGRSCFADRRPIGLGRCHAECPTNVDDLFSLSLDARIWPRPGAQGFNSARRAENCFFEDMPQPKKRVYFLRRGGELRCFLTESRLPCGATFTFPEKPRAGYTRTLRTSTPCSKESMRRTLGRYTLPQAKRDTPPLGVSLPPYLYFLGTFRAFNQGDLR